MPECKIETFILKFDEASIMNQASERKLAPLARVFTASADAELTHITNVEGGTLEVPIALKTLMVTDAMVVVETFIPAGQSSPPHQHDDHVSVVYLVSGKMKIFIEDEVFVAGPGDVWCNQPGVPHHLEALEDCLSVEIKSPPIKAW